MLERQGWRGRLDIHTNLSKKRRILLQLSCNFRAPTSSPGKAEVGWHGRQRRAKEAGRKGFIITSPSFDISTELIAPASEQRRSTETKTCDETMRYRPGVGRWPDHLDHDHAGALR
jgi:hypothetical protein